LPDGSSKIARNTSALVYFNESKMTWYRSCRRVRLCSTELWRDERSPEVGISCLESKQTHQGEDSGNGIKTYCGKEM